VTFAKRKVGDKYDDDGEIEDPLGNKEDNS